MNSNLILNIILIILFDQIQISSSIINNTITNFTSIKRNNYFMKDYFTNKLENYLTIFIYNKKRSLNIFYKPFDNEINSVYGTGNVLKDVVYKVNCMIKCKSHCCSGENFTNIKCLLQSQCLKKVEKVKKFILKVVFACYSTLAILTSIIVFIIYFFISKRFYDNKQSFKNGLATLLFSLSIFLILPILFLIIYSKLKKIRIVEILGGNFSKYKNLLLKTDVKNDEITNIPKREKNKINQNNNYYRNEINKTNFEKNNDLNFQIKNNNTNKVESVSECNLETIAKLKDYKIQKSLNSNREFKNEKNYIIVCNKDHNFALEEKPLEIDACNNDDNKILENNDSNFYSDLNRNIIFSPDGGESSVYIKNLDNNNHKTNKMFEYNDVSINEIELDN